MAKIEAGVFALTLALFACSAAEPAPVGKVESAPSHLVAQTLEAEARALAQAKGVSEVDLVAIDPRSGAVLAMTGGEVSGGSFALEPDLPAKRAHEPGSVMKPFTIAAALDAGAIQASAMFPGESGSWSIGGKTLRDSAPHTTMSIGDVLAFSSNIATAKIGAALGRDKLEAAFARFGFDMKMRDADDYEFALLAGGEAGSVTPLAIAEGFAALVNGGERFAPSTSGAKAEGTRAIRAETSRAMIPLLEGVVARDDGTGKEARVPGLRVAGKTGTAKRTELGADGTPHEVRGSFATFVGAVPAEAPRLVVLVSAATSEERYSGGTIAAPAFREIVTRLRGHGVFD